MEIIMASRPSTMVKIEKKKNMFSIVDNMPNPVIVANTARVDAADNETQNMPIPKRSVIMPTIRNHDPISLPTVLSFIENALF